MVQSPRLGPERSVPVTRSTLDQPEQSLRFFSGRVSGPKQGTLINLGGAHCVIEDLQLPECLSHEEVLAAQTVPGE